MLKRWKKQKETVVKKQNIGLVFFDLDGVLADCHWRLRFLENDDYEGFYAPENIMQDKMIEHGKRLLKQFVDAGYKVVITSSRRESCLEASHLWLRQNGIEIPARDIYLRKDGDQRKSWEVKVDLVLDACRDNMDEYLPLCNLHYFVDDYPANCEAVAKAYPSIMPLCFGIGRMNTGGC